MMRRRLSVEASRAMQRLSSDEALLPFVKITSGQLAEPICIVRDAPTFNGEPMRYIFQGREWVAAPFDLEYLTDSDEAPTAKLTIQNVDRRIGAAVRTVTERPGLEIYIIGSHEFNLEVNPRVGYGSPEIVPEAAALGLFLKNVTVNLISVSAEIVSWDDTQEAWPGTRATKDRCPGLYR